MMSKLVSFCLMIVFEWSRLYGDQLEYYREGQEEWTVQVYVFVKVCCLNHALIKSATLP